MLFENSKISGGLRAQSSMVAYAKPCTWKYQYRNKHFSNGGSQYGNTAFIKMDPVPTA